MARTFQNIRLFNDMTVLDNVKVGLHNQVVYGMWTGILRLPSFREKEHEMDRRAMKLLKFLTWMRRLTIRPANCPTANSASWKLPAPWLPTRNCCCWTSQQPV